MRSMTGFGRGEATLGDISISVSARAVNHRYFDCRLRAPSSLQHLGPDIEKELRKKLVRGRIEVQIRIARTESSAMQFDLDVMSPMLDTLRDMRDRWDPEHPVPFTLLNAFPQLFSSESSLEHQDEAAIKKATLEAVHQSADELNRFRKDEGDRLLNEFGERLQTLANFTAEAEKRVPQALEENSTRLRTRIAELLADESTFDESRFTQEVAQLAERSDVEEELSRLKGHFEQFRSEMNAKNDSVGRKLDFITQELTRESNTLSAKSPDLELRQIAIELKTEIERIREQVQNVL